MATQKEIVADIEKSQVAMYTGGGLIPALIDVAVENSRANSAEDAVRPIRDALLDYEIGTELHKALGTRLEAVPWLHVKKIEVVHDNRPKQVTSLLAASSEDALLLLIPTYALTSDFSTLKFDTEVRVVPRAAHLLPSEVGDDAEKRMAPLYKTKISHHVPLTVQGNSKTDVANAWASDGGKRIKEALQQSISRTADQIIEALSHPDRSPSTP
ncbi:MAG: hypothetical protein A4E19_03640 [Nitrospira sp. SG-bin1]|nr:MAG: hypothetical protein A4E19_03640 [Nitrospira sp. SG-bin1]